MTQETGFLVVVDTIADILHADDDDVSQAEVVLMGITVLLCFTELEIQMNVSLTDSLISVLAVIL